MQLRLFLAPKSTALDTKTLIEERKALFNEGKKLTKLLKISGGQFRDYCLSLIRSINTAHQLNPHDSLEFLVLGEKYVKTLLENRRNKKGELSNLDISSTEYTNLKNTLIQFTRWEIQHPDQTILFNSLSPDVFNSKNGIQNVSKRNILQTDFISSADAILKPQNEEQSFISICNGFCKALDISSYDNIVESVLLAISTKQENLMIRKWKKEKYPASERMLHIQIIKLALAQEVAQFLQTHHHTETSIKDILMKRITATRAGKSYSSTTAKKSKPKNTSTIKNDETHAPITKTRRDLAPLKSDSASRPDKVPEAPITRSKAKVLADTAEPGKKARIENPKIKPFNSGNVLTKDDNQPTIVPQSLESFLQSISHLPTTFHSDSKTHSSSNSTTITTTRSLLHSHFLNPLPSTLPISSEPIAPATSSESSSSTKIKSEPTFAGLTFFSDNEFSSFRSEDSSDRFSPNVDDSLKESDGSDKAHSLSADAWNSLYFINKR